MTRWHKRDLTGQIIKSSVQRAGVDEWEVMSSPPSCHRQSPVAGVLVARELTALRNELPAPKWNAQYQRNPTSEVRWSNGNGGRSGKRKDHHPVSSSFGLGIQRF